MAVKLNELYPGRVNAPTPAYPQGSFKNETALDAGDGTPLEQRWANDQLGFFSSLLAAAGMTPNGLVDQVGASQYFTALESVVGAAVPDATEAVKGKARFATSAESLAGSSTSVSETPAGARAQIAALSLGVGQTWQNVSGSRAAGTNYTNTTGRTIAIYVRNSPTGSNLLTMTVNTVEVGRYQNSSGGTSESAGMFALVPPSGVYRVDATSGTIAIWSELR